jgi:hypothetical protein
MTIGFEQLVDTVKALPAEQQDMLKELITKWRIEARRAEIARDAQASLEIYRTGQLKPQSAQTIITELQHSLSDKE